MRLMILTLFVFMVVSCNSQHNQPKDENITIDQDSVVDQTKHIIFHTLSQEKYDSLLAVGNDDFTEILSDFNYYAKEVEPFMKEKGFIVHYTNEESIYIDSMLVQFDDSVNVGATIIHDGHRFDLHGVYSTIDYKTALQEFLQEGKTD